MDISLINSQSLLHLLSLTEKKEELLQILEQIDNEILRTLQGGISVEVRKIASAPAAIAAPALKPPAAPKAPAAKPASKAPKSKPVKSGGLKERILSLLAAAGDQGLRVRDIATKLNAKPGNIAVWFSTTGKEITTKVEPGRYALKSSKAVPAVKPAKAAKPAKAKKKSGLTPEGRAKLAANMKARWAARKAGKPASKAVSPAKKGFKLPKKA